MKPLAAAFAPLIGGDAYAKDTEGCITAAGASRAGFAMPHVAAASFKRLDVVVIGGACSNSRVRPAPTSPIPVLRWR